MASAEIMRRLELHSPPSPTQRELIRFRRTGRIMDIVDEWSSTNPGKKLTLVRIREMLQEPIKSHTVSKILDQIIEKNPNFKDPRLYEREQRAAKMKRVEEFVQNWRPSRPGQKLTRELIWRELGLSRRFAKSSLNSLLRRSTPTYLLLLIFRSSLVWFLRLRI